MKHLMHLPFYQLDKPGGNMENVDTQQEGGSEKVNDQIRKYTENPDVLAALIPKLSEETQEKVNNANKTFVGRLLDGIT